MFKNRNIMYQNSKYFAALLFLKSFYKEDKFILNLLSSILISYNNNNRINS